MVLVGSLEVLEVSLVVPSSTLVEVASDKEAASPADLTFHDQPTTMMKEKKRKVKAASRRTALMKTMTMPLTTTGLARM